MPGTLIEIGAEQRQSPSEIFGTAPEYRWNETDQTDPAGRFRARVDGDILSIARASASGWASAVDLLQLADPDAPFTFTSGSYGSPISGTIILRMVAYIPAKITNIAQADRHVIGLAIENDLQEVGATTARSYGFLSHTVWNAANNSDWAGNHYGFYSSFGGADVGSIGSHGSFAYFWAENNADLNNMAITNIYGLRLFLSALQISGTGSCTNYYGLYIDAPSGATTLNRSIYVTGGVSEFRGVVNVYDDIRLSWGADNDIVGVNVSAGIAANTAITNVLVGTVVGPALAANSFVGSNITASGDYALYGNRGGNSECFLWYDSSVGNMNFYARGTGQFRLNNSSGSGAYLGVTTDGDVISGAERSLGIATILWGTLYLSGGITRGSLAGVAGGIVYNIPIGAGGAANAVVQHQFQLDSTIEAGLLGETDGAGAYTQAKTIWKVPYRDSGANVAAPTNPTTAATWLGGLRVEAGDDANRLYFYANEAWHYINQTAGFSFLHKEPTTFGDFNNWQYGELLALKVDRYNENGGHALPYPFERAVRETEWASTVEERLAAVEEANGILRSQLVAAGIVPEV